MLTIHQKVLIREQRKQGVSYKRIHEATGLRRGYISDYSNLIGKGVVVSQKALEAKRKQYEKVRADADKRETYVCKGCGKTYIRQRRVGDEGKTYCSRECAFEDYGKWHTHSITPVLNKPYESCSVSFPKCVICGRVFLSRHGKRQCIECDGIFYKAKAEEYTHAARVRYRVDNDIVLMRKDCVMCGATFTTYRGRQVCCSERCTLKKGRCERKARDRKSFVETVSIEILFNRDGGRCQLCGKKLKLKNKPPHLRAPTRDHIKPESLGGETSYKNMQLACFICNSKKGNRVAAGGEQLLLFGL